MSALAVARHLVYLATRDAVSVGMVPERLHLTLFYCQGWHWAWMIPPPRRKRWRAREESS